MNVVRGFGFRFWGWGQVPLCEIKVVRGFGFRFWGWGQVPLCKVKVGEPAVHKIKSRMDGFRLSALGLHTIKSRMDAHACVSIYDRCHACFTRRFGTFKTPL